MTKYLLVGLGGFLGSILRFWVGGAIDSRMASRFPYGTFVINISGSFLIGLIVTVLAESAHWHPNWRYLLPIGFIGAYTTFSTFELDIFRSLQDGLLLIALLNVVLSVTLGFLGLYLGVVTGRAAVHHESRLMRPAVHSIAETAWTQTPQESASEVAADAAGDD